MSVHIIRTNLPFILACIDRALGDVRQSVDVLSNGWETNSTILNFKYESLCDAGDTWYGYVGGSTPIGSIYATFQGFGTATLSFGNCLNQGSVKVFLNEKLISEVRLKGIKEVTFEYSIGDRLTISEYATIWKLYSLTLNCN